MGGVGKGLMDGGRWGGGRGERGEGESARVREEGGREGGREGEREGGHAIAKCRLMLWPTNKGAIFCFFVSWRRRGLVCACFVRVWYYVCMHVFGTAVVPPVCTCSRVYLSFMLALFYVGVWH